MQALVSFDVPAELDVSLGTGWKVWPSLVVLELDFSKEVVWKKCATAHSSLMENSSGRVWLFAAVVAACAFKMNMGWPKSGLCFVIYRARHECMYILGCIRQAYHCMHSLPFPTVCGVKSCILCVFSDPCHVTRRVWNRPCALVFQLFCLCRCIVCAGACLLQPTQHTQQTRLQL